MAQELNPDKDLKFRVPAEVELDELGFDLGTADCRPAVRPLWGEWPRQDTRSWKSQLL